LPIVGCSVFAPQFCGSIFFTLDIQALVQTLLQTIDRLEAKVAALEAELAVYKNKKNSSNSHIPPSQDQNRPKKIKACGCPPITKQEVSQGMKVPPWSVAAVLMKL
jgi:hypothetical protein